MSVPIVNTEQQVMTQEQIARFFGDNQTDPTTLKCMECGKVLTNPANFEDHVCKMWNISHQPHSQSDNSEDSPQSYSPSNNKDSPPVVLHKKIPRNPLQNITNQSLQGKSHAPNSLTAQLLKNTRP